MSSKELASRQDGAHDVVVLDVTEGDMKAASPKRERCLYDDADFRAFWTIYPRHENKKGAFRSWKKALEAGLRAEDILREATDYRELVAAENRDLRYVKHPTTFLNQLDADSIGDARKSMSDAAQFEREKEYMASTQRQRGMSMSQYSAEEETKAVRRQLETYPVLTTQDIDSAARDLGFMLEDIPQHMDMIGGLDKIKTSLEDVVPKMDSLVEAYNAYVASKTMEELARAARDLQAAIYATEGDTVAVVCPHADSFPPDSAWGAYEWLNLCARVIGGPKRGVRIVRTPEQAEERGWPLVNVAHILNRDYSKPNNKPEN